MRREDVEVAAGPIAGTIVVRIKAREEARGRGILRNERAPVPMGRQERVVPVAWDADIARAKVDVEHGVLTISVPKQTPAAREPGPETR